MIYTDVAFPENALREDHYQMIKHEAYLEAGLVYIGLDDEGLDEWIGRDEQWERANALLETKLNQ